MTVIRVMTGNKEESGQLGVHAQNEFLPQEGGQSNFGLGEVTLSEAPTCSCELQAVGPLHDRRLMLSVQKGSLPLSRRTWDIRSVVIVTMLR